MSTTNTTKPVETPAIAEAKAFVEKVEQLAKEGNNLGPDALREVARMLGASANKYGRPTLERFVAFALAMAGRNLSLNARVTLAQTANGAVSDWAKPVFRLAGKASEIEGTLGYKLNMPATFEASIS